jgi:dihydrofolate reductase
MFKLACRHSHGSICKAGLIDSVHLALVPVLLGQGEPLLHGLDLPALGFCVTDRRASEYATHFVPEKVEIQS